MFEYIDFQRKEGYRNKGDLKFFGLSTCGFCKRAMSFLSDNGIQYDCVLVDEIDPELKKKAKEEKDIQDEFIAFVKEVQNAYTKGGSTLKKTLETAFPDYFSKGKPIPVETVTRKFRGRGSEEIVTPNQGILDSFKDDIKSSDSTAGCTGKVLSNSKPKYILGEFTTNLLFSFGLVSKWKLPLVLNPIALSENNKILSSLALKINLSEFIITCFPWYISGASGL